MLTMPVTLGLGRNHPFRRLRFYRLDATQVDAVCQNAATWLKADAHWLTDGGGTVLFCHWIIAGVLRRDRLWESTRSAAAGPRWRVSAWPPIWARLLGLDGGEAHAMA
jgi:hypothetical protein